MIKDKQKNRLVFEVTPVRSYNIQPWKMGFSVRLYNSIDNIHNWMNNNSDNTPDYCDAEFLEDTLNLIRDICIGTMQEIRNDLLKVKKELLDLSNIEITIGEEPESSNLC